MTPARDIRPLFRGRALRFCANVAHDCIACLLDWSATALLLVLGLVAIMAIISHLSYVLGY